MKKDYSKGAVNVVEISQIRLQKLKKNEAMANFYCSVSQILKKKYFMLFKTGKNTWFALFLKHKKWT